jgi:hypothetical protein
VAHRLGLVNVQVVQDQKDLASRILDQPPHEQDQRKRSKNPILLSRL